MGRPQAVHPSQKKGHERKDGRGESGDVKTKRAGRIGKARRKTPLLLRKGYSRELTECANAYLIITW